MWWEGDRLLGFLGIYGSESAPELAGIVSPDARRRGIGGALVDAALPLCREQSERRPLLIVPRPSAAGQRLALRRGGVLDHSEHALVLSGEPTTGSREPPITLRPAAAARSSAHLTPARARVRRPWARRVCSTLGRAARADSDRRGGRVARGNVASQTRRKRREHLRICDRSLTPRPRTRARSIETRLRAATRRRRAPDRLGSGRRNRSRTHAVHVHRLDAHHHRGTTSRCHQADGARAPHSRLSDPPLNQSAIDGRKLPLAG